MKHIMMLVLVMTVFFGTNNITYAGDSDIIITQEALMNMDSSERDVIFESMRKQKKAIDKVVNTETIKSLTDMDVETFKGKSIAVADTLVVFFDKLGVKANEFIKTDVGLLAAIGIIYKMGVFGSVWNAIVCSVGVIVFLTILFKLNTKKVIKTHKYNNKDEIISSEEEIVPAFSAVSGYDADDITTYSVAGSLVCTVIVVMFLIFM